MSEGGIIGPLRRDVCPDCDHVGLDGGPRGGAGQNIFCPACGAGFNVAPPRFIMFVERIGSRKPTIRVGQTIQ